jgi:hypothetical protein
MAEEEQGASADAVRAAMSRALDSPHFDADRRRPREGLPSGTEPKRTGPGRRR